MTELLEPPTLSAPGAAEKMREALALLDKADGGAAACLLQQAIDMLDDIWSSMTTMIYRVQLLPRPIVIDDQGLPVPHSHVVDIIFPMDPIETMMGRLDTIVGAGVAKIIIGDTTYRGVALCWKLSGPTTGQAADLTSNQAVSLSRSLLLPCRASDLRDSSKSPYRARLISRWQEKQREPVATSILDTSFFIIVSLYSLPDGSGIADRLGTDLCIFAQLPSLLFKLVGLGVGFRLDLVLAGIDVLACGLVGAVLCLAHPLGWTVAVVLNAGCIGCGMVLSLASLLFWAITACQHQYRRCHDRVTHVRSPVLIPEWWVMLVRWHFNILATPLSRRCQRCRQWHYLPSRFAEHAASGSRLGNLERDLWIVNLPPCPCQVGNGDRTSSGTGVLMTQRSCDAAQFLKLADRKISRQSVADALGLPGGDAGLLKTRGDPRRCAAHEGQRCS